MFLLRYKGLKQHRLFFLVRVFLRSICMVLKICHLATVTSPPPTPTGLGSLAACLILLHREESKMAPGQYCTRAAGADQWACWDLLSSPPFIGGGDWQDITSHSRPFDLLIFGRKKTPANFYEYMNCSSLVI
jgi:hypothetical protein